MTDAADKDTFLKGLDAPNFRGEGGIHDRVEGSPEYARSGDTPVGEEPQDFPASDSAAILPAAEVAEEEVTVDEAGDDEDAVVDDEDAVAEEE